MNLSCNWKQIVHILVKKCQNQVSNRLQAESSSETLIGLTDLLFEQYALKRQHLLSAFLFFFFYIPLNKL